MTEAEKMLAGKLYDPVDETLVCLRAEARRLCKAYNDCDPMDGDRQEALLRALVPALGEDSWINAPVQFDYGRFTTIGKRCFFNYNLTVLDCAPVTIGDDVFVGPNVSLMPPMHPLLDAERRLYRRADGVWTDREYAKPITIGDGCWIAANVVIAGGVTIGPGTVVGAGSVVTRDLPGGVLAAGNPCRVIRTLGSADSIENKQELW